MATVASGDVPGLTITPPQDFSGLIALTVTATDTGDSAPLNVQVSGVADPPTLTSPDASGAEDTPIPLAINAATTDIDGSERLTVAISGIPDGATISFQGYQIFDPTDGNPGPHEIIFVVPEGVDSWTDDGVSGGFHVYASGSARLLVDENIIDQSGINTAQPCDLGVSWRNSEYLAVVIHSAPEVMRFTVDPRKQLSGPGNFTPVRGAPRSCRISLAILSPWRRALRASPRPPWKRHLP